jgi:prophage DNA circulation protein
MSWRDQLQTGSFRGVAFRTRTADGQLGRRIALHEYPGRDLPYAEDLGRKARRFVLDLYVIGEDYMQQRDRLWQALEESGAGPLVHPWFGQIDVVVLDVRGPNESTRDGGRARFSVEFVEAGQNIEPRQRIDTAAKLKDQAYGVNEQLIEDFSRRFDVSGAGYIATEARSRLQQAADAIDEISRLVSSPGVLATEHFNNLAAFADSLSSLIASPGNVAIALIGLVQGVADMADKPLEAFDVYRQLFSWGEDADPVPETTPSRLRQAGNQTAVADLVRRSALIAAAAQAADHDYRSIDQAVTVRDTLIEQLETESLTADDDLYQDLLDLRVAVLADIDARGIDLPRIVVYTPPATLPAVVLAHRLYGDPLRATDLVERNNVRHPGFVPGGDPLEVLSDA